MADLIGKVKRYMSEKLSSVEDTILSYQEGTATSGINTAYTFIPCAIETPANVIITPVTLLGADGAVVSANSTAFPSMAELDSLTVFSAIANLADYATSTVYYVGTIVKATPTNGSLSAYVCNAQYTSVVGGGDSPITDSFDSSISKWTKLPHTKFLKVKHTSAGANKVASFNYKIDGYKIY